VSSKESNSLGSSVCYEIKTHSAIGCQRQMTLSVREIRLYEYHLSVLARKGVFMKTYELQRIEQHLDDIMLILEGNKKHGELPDLESIEIDMELIHANMLRLDERMS
jgi:hypothetical protein